jgi:eukaryotic-like serine/threonine-protein kinase
MSITRYCDEHKLSIEQRLRLFEQVCEGVHHAHQKGIIHRDLKPSNILVSVHGDRAVPKIIDFGIAKAITQPLTDKTFVTFQGQLLGTPEYMSPEQVDLATQDIDTRSDIYSLGVVLYELLAGVLPFEEESFARAGLAEIQQTIREIEPASPSIRLTSLGERAKTIAASRGTQVVPLARRLHRELEWIPLKAMRKDRCRRYKSTSEMADDIRNYLNGNPLIAGPETTIYRVQKFVRKHAGSVATVVLVAAAIVLGLIVSTAMYFRAEKMRVQADQARQKEVIARTEAEQATKKEAAARVEAEQAKNAEQEQRKLAEDRAENLRRSMYVNNIQLADDKYRGGNIRRVRELLMSCPNDLRGWEWNRLNYISDQSIKTISNHASVFSAIYSYDGRHIVSGGYDGKIRIWDAVTGKEIKVLVGHKGPVQSVAISKDGQFIVSGSWDKTIKIWNTESGQEVKTMSGHKDIVWCVALSPDGKVIASVSPGDTVVRLWDAKTGKELISLRGHKSGIDQVVFSPDGKFIISGDNLGDIKFWDTTTYQELYSFHAHDGVILGIAVKHDGSQIASVGGWDNEVRVWDTKTRTLAMTMRGHISRVESVAFSQDGKRIVSGGSDNTIRVWSVATGKELLVLRGHQDTIGTVTFSPDDECIMSGSDDDTIRLWDPVVNRETVTLARHQRPITSIAFSPDGRKIASVSDDGMAIVWEVESMSELMLLHGRSRYKSVNSVSFSPNGKLIASSCGRRTMKIWNAETGQELQTLHTTEQLVWDISFSPDNRQIVAASITKGEGWDTRKGAVEI